MWCWIGSLYSACHSRAFIRLPDIKQLQKELSSSPPSPMHLFSIKCPSAFICLFQFASVHLCKGHNVNWNIQRKDPRSSVRAITLQWRSLEPFVMATLSFETQASVVMSMQFPSCFHLVTVFQTHPSSFICREGGVCWNHNREPNPRKGKEFERKKVLKGTCWLLVAIKVAVTLTALSPATFSQTSAQLCSRLAWPF